MSRPLIFLGSSHQITIQFTDVCEQLGIPIAGIIDSDYYGNTESLEEIPYIGSEVTADFDKLKQDYDFFIGVSHIPELQRNIDKRLKFIDIVNQYNLPCVNLIDPDTKVSRRAKLGKGIYIGYHSIVESNVSIGDHTQINYLVCIGHDSTIGSNCVFQRGVTMMSQVTIGNNNYFGASSRLLKTPNMVVGNNCFVHPGIVVMRDISDNEVVSMVGRKVYSAIVT